MPYVLLLAVPLIGVVWFLNFVQLINHIKHGKDIRNQTIAGAVLTFVVVFVFMYWLAGIH
ncbi:hypothetical protein [Neobacillus rhizophilus]|uniref:Uncharacterized protein n=1 Tax=Neobacillus rhizophilus TaxID=2833579 RepID=A0A942UBS3_9BACI|nr:hypothetical protein [Neobacillus rhizophilus]MBS4216158.1 hypothetical protein [Neobacillus rhizophilus]MBU8917281.1 hypothetical protein [Bacillus sp. FJAT-29953]